MRTAIPLPRRLADSSFAWPLVAALLAGVVIRAAALPFPGCVLDIQEFTGWAMLVMRYGLTGLYTHLDPITGHAVNYPPMYAFVLAATTRLYEALHLADPHQRILAMMIKLPATLADVGLCAVTYLIVRRWFSPRRALAATAIAATTPSIWFISAYWGQVDSVAAFFVVLALYLAISERYFVAWLCLALGVLVKPLPIVIAPLLLLWQLRDQGISPRLALGPSASAAIAYIVSLPFAPSPQPLAVFAWLAHMLQDGIQLFREASIGAFNIYTVVGRFSQSDETPLLGVPLRLWGDTAFGVLLTLVAVTLWIRITGEQDDVAREQALITACLVVLAGMFMFLTRMHERYLFFAVALVPALWFAGKVERAIGATMMTTFTINCIAILSSGLLSPHSAAGVHGDGAQSLVVTHGRSAAWVVVHVVSLINVLALAALAFYQVQQAVDRRGPRPAKVHSPLPLGSRS
jgi:Gpi18-like mannosyltransferase